MHQSSPNYNRNLAAREGWVALVLNTLLFIIKLWAGIISGSIALIADAWHTLSDSLTSLVLLAGIKISLKPADRDHPFGHGRAEIIATLVIGILLAVVAFSFLTDSIGKLRSHEQATYGPFAIIATILSIITKEGLAQYAFSIFRKTKYLAVKADAWHHRSDAISSVLILVGIIIGSRFWFTDGILGIVVSMAIFYAAYDILKDTVDVLLGEVPDATMLDLLKEISLKSSQRDVKLHHIHIHRYGDHTELTCHIKLPPEMPLHEAHRISSVIENEILDHTGMIATIHMEPKE